MFWEVEEKSRNHVKSKSYLHEFMLSLKMARNQEYLVVIIILL